MLEKDVPKFTPEGQARGIMLKKEQFYEMSEGILRDITDDYADYFIEL